MKRLFVEFAFIICSLILPVHVFAASGFSGKLLLDELQSNDDICFPRICSGINNDIYIVWLDENKNGATSIYFTRSLDGGLSFEKKREIEVAPDEDVTLAPPVIGVDPNGILYIVYSRYDSNKSQFTLLLKKSVNSGDNFKAQTIIERQSSVSNIIGSQYGSDIKFTDKGIYYVWTSYSDIFLVRIMKGENGFEAIVIEDEQSDTDESIFARYKIWPSLAVDSNDNAYVVWHEAHINEDNISDPKLFDLYSAKLEKGHHSFTEYEMIAKCDSFQGFVTSPSIITTSSNEVFIFWNNASSNFQDDPLTQHLYKTSSKDEGATFSEPTEITFGEVATVQNHGVSIDQNDDMHFIYFLASNGTLYYCKSSDLGNSFDEKLKINRMAFWADLNLSINKKIVYVVWPYKQQDKPKGIYFSKSSDEVSVKDISKEKSGSGGCFILSVLH